MLLLGVLFQLLTLIIFSFVAYVIIFTFAPNVLKYIKLFLHLRLHCKPSAYQKISFASWNFGLGQIPVISFPKQGYERWIRSMNPNNDPVRINSLLMKPYVLIQCPKLLKQILVTDAHKFVKSPTTFDFVREVIGNGVAVSEGERWRRSRTMIQSSVFTARNLENMCNSVMKSTVHRIMLEEWPEKYSSSSSNNASVLVLNEFSSVMAHLLLNTVMETVFGQRLDYSKLLMEAYSDLIEDLIRMFEFSLLIPHTHLLPVANRARKYKQRLSSIASELIKLRRMELKNNSVNIEHVDVLSMMMCAEDREHGVFSDEQMIDEALILLFAGTNSTSSLISSTIFTLLKHPDVLEKMRAEIDAIPNMSDVNYQFLANMENLPITNRVIKEIQRLYPPLITVDKMCTSDVTIGDYSFPKGTEFWLHTSGIQRDPSLWSDTADKFDPDRWLPERSKDISRFQYTVFSVGHRDCIGKYFASIEARLILVTLFKHYDISFANQTTKDKVTMGLDPLVKPFHLDVELKKRSI